MSTNKETMATIQGMLSASGGKITKDFFAKKADNSTLSQQAFKAAMLSDMKAFVQRMDSFRAGSNQSRPIDMTLERGLKEVYGFGSVDAFMQSLGVDPSHHSIQGLATMPDFQEDFRWLIPEVIRAAIRLGLRRQPIHSDLIAGEEAVTQTKVTMPHINMSDAAPERVNEAETIPIGTASFGQRDVTLHKIGKGIRLSDEVLRYVSLNILSVFLQDMGVQLGLGQDTALIDALVNGDESADAFTAPVIGVANTTDGITYKDLLRAWLRMGALGRSPSAMLSNEAAALDILLMDEFKGWSPNTNGAHKNLNVRVPIPQTQNFFVHGNAPSGTKLVLVDSMAAAIKLNATSLLVESERIASNQINGTYATITTGFARLFQDAVLVIDGGQAFSSLGFPAYMDVAARENVKFD